MSLHLIQKFAARPGGYVSLRNETNLLDLGVVSKSSHMAGKTSQEYCLRLLGKCADYVQQKCLSEGLRTLNVCFDGAMVAEENAPLTRNLRMLLLRLFNLEGCRPTFNL